MKSAWDNGHGGPDGGALAKTKQTEAKTNLNVVNFAVPAAQSLGHKTLVTNPNNIKLGINERAKMVNDFNPDACLSVHHNAGGGTYSLVIYQNNNPKSKLLAEYIAAEIRRRFPNRKVTVQVKLNSQGKDYFGMLRMVKCPTVITEFGFMDSKDLEMFDTFTEQRIEAEIFVVAVEKFRKEVLKK